LTRLVAATAWVRTRSRLLTGVCFSLVTVTACVLVGQRLTHSSWPLAHARTLPVGFATLCYFASFILRARGWHRLFPPEQQPDQARCLASVGAAAASRVVLPFRLDYLVKVGTLRRLSGVRIGLQAVALSIVSLGVVDAIAMLPLSVSATATSSRQLPRASLDRRCLRPWLLRATPRERPPRTPSRVTQEPPPQDRFRACLCAPDAARASQCDRRGLLPVRLLDDAAPACCS